MRKRDEAAGRRRPLTLRLPNETLAALQVTSAAIRRSTGKAIGASAIIRALIAWLAETDIDTRRVRTPADLRRQLLAKVRRKSGGSDLPEPPGPAGPAFSRPGTLAAPSIEAGAEPIPRDEEGANSGRMSLLRRFGP